MTRASFVKFPDGGCRLTGVHFPQAAGRSRPPTTPEERRKIADDRARRTVNDKVRYYQMDRMWTPTYRGPQTDRALLLKHLGEWERRVRSLYPEFKIVGVPEKHRGGGANHGGYHFHGASRGFMDINIVRTAWQRAISPLEGTVNIEGPRHPKLRSGLWTSHQIGNYLMKYMTKEFDEGDREPGEHRYYCSHGLDVPYVKRELVGSCSFARLILFRMVAAVLGGDLKVKSWVSDDGLRFMFGDFW